jgi:hypothetical protein
LLFQNKEVKKGRFAACSCEAFTDCNKTQSSSMQQLMSVSEKFTKAQNNTELMESMVLIKAFAQIPKVCACLS